MIGEIDGAEDAAEVVSLVGCRAHGRSSEVVTDTVSKSRTALARKPGVRPARLGSRDTRAAERSNGVCRREVAPRRRAQGNDARSFRGVRGNFPLFGPRLTSGATFWPRKSQRSLEIRPAG